MILWGLGCENMALGVWVVSAIIHYVVNEMIAINDLFEVEKIMN